MQEIKQETKTSSLKKVLIWIVGIWALITFAGFVTEVFSYVIYVMAGGGIDVSKLDVSQLLVGISAGLILAYLYFKRGRLWTTNI